MDETEDYDDDEENGTGMEEVEALWQASKSTKRDHFSKLQKRLRQLGKMFINQVSCGRTRFFFYLNIFLCYFLYCWLFCIMSCYHCLFIVVIQSFVLMINRTASFYHLVFVYLYYLHFLLFCSLLLSYIFF